MEGAVVVMVVALGLRGVVELVVAVELAVAVVAAAVVAVALLPPSRVFTSPPVPSCCNALLFWGDFLALSSGWWS